MRYRITIEKGDKRQFVPRDQVFSYVVVYSLLLKLAVSRYNFGLKTRRYGSVYLGVDVLGVCEVFFYVC